MELKKIEEIYRNPKEMFPLTNKEKYSFENSKMCYICENEF
jgi:hypothetical protein